MFFNEDEQLVSMDAGAQSSFNKVLSLTCEVCLKLLLGLTSGIFRYHDARSGAGIEKSLAFQIAIDLGDGVGVNENFCGKAAYAGQSVAVAVAFRRDGNQNTFAQLGRDRRGRFWIRFQPHDRTIASTVALLSRMIMQRRRDRGRVRSDFLFMGLICLLILAAFLFLFWQEDDHDTIISGSESGDGFQGSMAVTLDDRTRGVLRSPDTENNARNNRFSPLRGSDASFVGQIVDSENDQGIEGVQIVVVDTGGHVKKGTSEGSGSFRLLSPAAKTLRLLLTKNGYGTVLLGPHRLRNGEEKDLGKIVLAPGATLSGQVFDASTRSIAGAVVSLRPIEVKRGLGEILLGFDELFSELPAVARTQTDKNGSYVIENVPHGYYQASVTAIDYGDQHRTDLWINKNRHQTEVDFHLNVGGSLRGTLVDDGGAPLADVKVLAVPASSSRDLSVAIRRKIGRTEKDGRFLLQGLALGLKDLVFLRADGVSLIEKNVVPDGEDRSYAMVGAERVEGRLYDEKSQEPSPGTRLGFYGNGIVVTTTTDAKGRYRTGPIKPGYYVIVVDSLDKPLRSEDLNLSLKSGDGLKKHDLRICEGATIEGRVVVGNTGLGIANAEVFITSNELDGRPRCSTRSDENGAFRLSNAPLAKVLVQARARGFAVATKRGSVATKYFSLLKSGSSEGGVELKLRKKLVLSGQVVDEFGQPLPAVVLETGQESAFQKGMDGQESESVLSDSAGRFSFAVSPDKYGGVLLRARHRNFASFAKRIRLKNEGQQEVQQDIVLKRGIEIFGKILDLSNRAISGVVVRCQLVGADHSYRTRYIQEAERLGMLAHSDGRGEWRMRVPRRHVKLDYEAVGLVHLTPNPGTIRHQNRELVEVPTQLFAPAMSLAGRLLVNGVAPAKDFRIQVQRNSNPGPKIRRKTAVRQGRFAFDSLIEGFYDLEVFDMRQKKIVAKYSGIAAGRKDLLLNIE